MSTQARREKRARIESDDEFESSQRPGSSSTQRKVKTAPDEGRGDTDWDEEEIQRKVKDVVRYALSSEFKRKPMKRDEILRIIGANGRKATFTQILNIARDKLVHVFGMSISELPTSKDKMNQSQTQKKNKGRAAAGNDELSTQAGGPSTQNERTGTSGTYILNYNMKEEYRTPSIIERSSKEYSETGILYVILGLIFLNQQSMTSPNLYGQLNRLKLADAAVRDSYITNFIQNGYLKRTKKPETSGEEIEYDFTWGSRALVEIPHNNIVPFLLSFFNGSEEEKRELGVKMFKQAGYQNALAPTQRR